LDVVEDGTVTPESFELGAFVGTPERVPVLLRHRDEDVVGHLLSPLTVSLGWHVAAFVLDHERPLSALAADRLRVGSPVSIGFHSRWLDRALAEVGVRLHTSAELVELSIAGPNDHAGFPGAEVVSIVERPRTRRTAVLATCPYASAPSGSFASIRRT
jgi:hypothetical protein